MGKMPDFRSVTNDAVLAGLARWKDKMFASTIPQSEPLNQAQIQRTDIFTFDPKSTGAAAYEVLAREIEGLIETNHVE